MYDVIVVGQGLTGLLSAIVARKQNKKVALVAKGTGKMLQSTGLMDLVPGSNKDFSQWMELYGLSNREKITVKDAINEFKRLTEKIGYEYVGDVDKLANVVTSSGHLKSTALYPKTITPIPEKGRVVIVGFNEIVDFQPEFLKGNLQKVRPDLQIGTMSVRLDKNSQRTLTQLDAARALDEKDSREHILKQIKEKMKTKSTEGVDLFIFPAALGVQQWEEVHTQFCTELKAKVTEAPGLPPNATAIRLHERLRKEAIKLGVRFYADTEVNGFSKKGTINEITIKMNNRSAKLQSDHLLICTGGILGGGLEQTAKGLKETTLQLSVNKEGAYVNLPNHVYPVGASLGTNVIHYGITGGIYSVVSSYLTNLQIERSDMRGLQRA